MRSGTDIALISEREREREREQTGAMQPGITVAIGGASWHGIAEPSSTTYILSMMDEHLLSYTHTEAFIPATAAAAAAAAALLSKRHQPFTVSVQAQKYSRLRVCFCRSSFVPYDAIRYDTRCYFNVLLKANMSQLNLPHGTNN